MMTKQSATVPSNRTLNHADPFGKKYKILAKIGEGSYSEVLKCKNRETGATYACKRLKHCYRSWSQVNDIPELVTLRKLALHPNILQMVEIHFDPTAGRVYLVFELMELNLYELIKDRKRLLSEARVRIMMFQLIRALRHLHKHGIFHRDVKPENILLKNDLLKLGDLGSVRGLYSRPPYTEYISTRWYRSPECLLTCGYYSFKMDVWAAGCVFYEILTLRPLFPGSSELDQINRVHKILGPPPLKLLQKFSAHAEIERDYSRHASKQARLDTIKRVLLDIKSTAFDWQLCGKDITQCKGIEGLLPTHTTPEAKDLLKHLLQYDPDCRPSSHRALQHAYFKDLRIEVLREQAQKAAQDKMSTRYKGQEPIVTIVGDEKGLAVTKDENDNPTHLGTLGDAKAKLLSSRRYGENASIPNTKISAKVSKDKTDFLQILPDSGTSQHKEPIFEKLIAPVIKDPVDQVYATQLSSLQLSGDGAQEPVLPYQEMYMVDKGDGPKESHAPVLLPKDQFDSYYFARHPSENEQTTELERKQSVTALNRVPVYEHPLDLVDKSTLTQESLRRINENRRIAQMRPLISSKFSKTYISNFPEQSRPHSSPPESRSTFSPRGFNRIRNPIKDLKTETISKRSSAGTHTTIGEHGDDIKMKKANNPTTHASRLHKKYEEAIRLQTLAYATSSRDKSSKVSQIASDTARIRVNDNNNKGSSKLGPPPTKDRSNLSWKYNFSKIGQHSQSSFGKNQENVVKKRDTKQPRPPVNPSGGEMAGQPKMIRRTSESPPNPLPWHLRREHNYKYGLNRMVQEQNKIEINLRRQRASEVSATIISSKVIENVISESNNNDNITQITQRTSDKKADSEKQESSSNVPEETIRISSKTTYKRQESWDYKPSELVPLQAFKNKEPDYDRNSQNSKVGPGDDKFSKECIDIDFENGRDTKENKLCCKNSDRKIDASNTKKRWRNLNNSPIKNPVFTPSPRRIKHSDLTEKTSSRNNVSKDSTKRLISGQKFQSKIPSQALERVSAALAVPNTFTASNSIVNKQVREILAEMRKRRDSLEDKVSQDPTLYQSLHSSQIKNNIINSRDIKPTSSKNYQTLSSRTTESKYRTNWLAYTPKNAPSNARTQFPSIIHSTIPLKASAFEAKRSMLSPENERPKSRYRYKSDYPRTKLKYNGSYDKVGKSKTYGEKFNDSLRDMGSSLHAVPNNILPSSKEFPRNRHVPNQKK